MNPDDLDLDAITAALVANPALLARVAGAVQRQLKGDMNRSRIEPGVVTAMRNRENGFPALSVLVDGDDIDNVTPINPISYKHPSDLVPGERVMVLFDPPNAPYYIGSITDRGGTGYARPYSTRVVAASDSIATDWRNADYVCDGTDDDEEIQAAIDSVGTAGRVLLLEGTYTIGTDAIRVGDGAILAGLGREAVLLSTEGTGAVITLDGGVVEDLSIFAGQASVVFAVESSGAVRRVDATTTENA